MFQQFLRGLHFRMDVLVAGPYGDVQSIKNPVNHSKASVSDHKWGFSSWGVLAVYIHMFLWSRAASAAGVFSCVYSHVPVE